MLGQAAYAQLLHSSENMRQREITIRGRSEESTVELPRVAGVTLAPIDNLRGRVRRRRGGQLAALI